MRAARMSIRLERRLEPLDFVYSLCLGRVPRLVNIPGHLKVHPEIDGSTEQLGED